MRRCFGWLVEHEKLLVGVTLLLVALLIIQIKFGKTRTDSDAALAQRRPDASHVERSSDSEINVAGVWEMSVLKKRGGTQTWTLTLRQDGRKLSGIINSEGGDLPVTGTIENRNIELSAKRLGVTVEFPATVDGNVMTGDMRVMTVNRRWTARRRT